MTAAGLEWAAAPGIAPERAAEYRRRGWWIAERVDDLVRSGARKDPHAPAVAGPSGELTHGELCAAVDGAAVRLAALGIAAGDRIVVQLPNDLELIVLTLAAMRIGAHPVMAMPALRARELRRVIETTRPAAMAVPRRLGRFDHLALARELSEGCDSLRLLLVADRGGSGVRSADAGPQGADTGGADRVRVVDLIALCEPRREDDDPPDLGPPADGEPAVFLLSSGTTGPPKSIARTHEGYGYMIRLAAQWAGLSRATVLLAVMSGCHGFVLNCPGILGTLAAGGRVVLGSADDPNEALDLVDRYGVTHCALVPALVTRWLTAARDRGRAPRSLRVVQVGGAKLEPGPAAEAMRVFGCVVQQCYGMSEGLLNYTALDDPEDVVTGTQGRPASPGDEIRIVGDDGEPVPPGAVGALLTRGPYTVAGYYADPEASERAFTADGFYRTGDLVRLHPSGCLVVEGRLGDVINRGGEKISAGEVESLLAQHPAVGAAAAVAMPHPVWGQCVCVFATRAPAPAEPPDLLGLRRYLQQCGIAPFKLPEHLEVVDALPMVGVGKIDRVALRRSAAALAEAAEKR